MKLIPERDAVYCLRSPDFEFVKIQTREVVEVIGVDFFAPLHESVDSIAVTPLRGVGEGQIIRTTSGS